MHLSTDSQSPRYRAACAALEVGILAGSLGLLALVFYEVPAWSGRATSTTLVTPVSDVSVIAGEADAHRVRRLLEDLRVEFRQHFAPLIRTSHPVRPTRVLLFNSESEYRAYARRIAPALTGSDGFYASTENTLAILDQTSRTPFSRASAQIARRQRRLELWTEADPQQRWQARARLAQWREEVATAARASTDRLIRHEGAHQLFHIHGIESSQPVEPTWLAEGLAQYCETVPIGAYYEPLAKRFGRARQAGTLMPVCALLNHRHPSGFFALGEDSTEIAYAESWALTFWLMQPERRDGFFAFINHYRDICTSTAAATEQHQDVGIVLAAYLRTDVETLESQWQHFISNL